MTTASLRNIDSDQAKRPAQTVLGDVDRRLVAALQASPRASWAKLAGTIGVSESVALRHGRSLLDSGIVQVSALPDPIRCGFGFPVLIRLTCEVGSAQTVAETLAQRTDARLVLVLAGTHDVLVELVVATRRQLQHVLVDALKGIRGVLRSESATVVRNFKTSYNWAAKLLDRQAEEPAEFADDSAIASSPRKLTDSDLSLIRLLAADGRQQIRELAGQSGLSESSVRRHIDALQENRLVHFATIVEPATLGYEAPIMIWFKLDLRHLHTVARQLSAIPEVRYISATTGRYQLVAEVILTEVEAIYSFMTSVIPALEHIDKADVELELDTLKRGYLPMV